MGRAAVIATMVAQACGGGEQGSAPAAALAPIPGDMPLDSTLAMLEAELESALGGGTGDDDVNRSLLRAEAISDRLLESRMPFEWLSGAGYSVEARLRQVQSLADRVAAQLRVRGPRDRMLADAEDLRRQVAQLRADLARGGGAAPTPLDELLQRRDTLDASRPDNGAP